MKLTLLILIIATVFIFNNVSGHGAPSAGQVNFCIMCNTTTNCAAGTSHGCVKVPLNNCTTITSKCDNSTMTVLISQNEQTVTTSIYDDAKCVEAAKTNITSTCEQCTTNGAYELLCAADSDASTATSSSIASISILIFAALVIIASLF